jgi:N12 class adenine-specific DNA methylase/GGDEF domain-containing protein
MDRGVGGDIAGAFGVTEPSLQAPSVGQTATSLVEAGAARAAGATEELPPEARAQYERAHRRLGVTEAIGRTLGTFAADVATDPALAGLGRLSAMSGAGRALETAIEQKGLNRVVGEVAQAQGIGLQEAFDLVNRAIGQGATADTVHKVASATFVPGMVHGAIENLGGAYDTYKAEGVTPRAVEQGLSGTLEAGFAASMVPGLLSRRPAFRYPAETGEAAGAGARPPAGILAEPPVEADYTIHPEALPTAPQAPFRPGEEPIDAEYVAEPPGRLGGGRFLPPGPDGGRPVAPVPPGLPGEPWENLGDTLAGGTPGAPRLTGQPAPTDLATLEGGDLVSFSPAAAAAAAGEGLGVPPESVRGPGAPPRTPGELAAWQQRAAAVMAPSTPEPEGDYLAALNNMPTAPAGLQQPIEPEVMPPTQAQDFGPSVPSFEKYTFPPDFVDVVTPGDKVHPDYYEAIWQALSPQSRAAMEQYGVFDVPEPMNERIGSEIAEATDRYEGIVGDQLVQPDELVNPPEPGEEPQAGNPPLLSEGLPPRGAERRQTAGAPPQGVERRLAERRTQVAGEVGLPEQHPAVERVAQAEHEARTDPLTGMGNRKAFEERMAAPDAPPHKVTWDVEGLKWANDNLPGGHEVGDSILKSVADAFHEEGIEGFRTGGDEFYSLASTPEEAEALIGKVRSRLADAVVEARHPDGTVERYKGIGIWGGHGTDLAAAENALHAVKAGAVEQGIRAPRGERPTSLSQAPAEGHEVQGEPPAAPVAGPGLHELVQQQIRAPRRADEPPVEPGMARLYRGEVTPGSERAPVPEWVSRHPEFAAIKDATGRWFTADRSEAEWYANDASRAKENQRLVYVDVPEGELAQHLVSGKPAARWSAKPNEEFFVPREWAEKAQPLGAPAVPTPEAVTAAAEQAVEPTPAQAEAGNYQKGHLKWQGLDVSIETPKSWFRYGKVTAEDVRDVAKGEPRRIQESLEHVAKEIESGDRTAAYKTLRFEAKGRGPSALTRLAERAWYVAMPAHYGYIRRTEGADGEQVDVFMGDNPESPHVFVIDQLDTKTDRFDESKAMLGFDNEEEARSTYRGSFSDEKGGERLGAITPLSVDEFKKWLKDGDTTKPLAPQRQRTMVFKPMWPPNARSQRETVKAPWEPQGKAPEPAPEPKKPDKALIIPTRAGIVVKPEGEPAHMAGEKPLPTAPLDRQALPVRLERARRRISSLEEDLTRPNLKPKVKADLELALNRAKARLAEMEGEAEPTEVQPAEEEALKGITEAPVKAMEEGEAAGEKPPEPEEPPPAPPEPQRRRKGEKPEKKKLAARPEAYEGFGRQGSAYEGDNLAAILPTVENEQLNRAWAISQISAVLERSKGDKFPVPGHTKKRERLKKEMESLQQLLEDTYSEVEQAGGERAVSAMRERVGEQLLEALAPEEPGATVEQEAANAPTPADAGRKPENVESAPATGQPPERTPGEDPGALEAVQPEPAPTTQPVGPARKRTDLGSRPDDRGVPPGGEERDDVRRGVGAGEGGVAPAAGAGAVADPPPSDTTEYVEAIAEDKSEAKAVVAKKNRGTDYVIKDETLGQVGPKAAARANLAALKILKDIEAEDRPATPEEQETLAHYTGWGRLPQMFHSYDREFQAERDELEETLSSDDLAAARASTINAHYTSVPIVRAMWDGVRRLGIQNHARILEPAMGVGNFYGTQPKAMLPAQRTGVEMDSVSGRIAKALYPRASVFIKPFQHTSLPGDHYDLVITNVPFANVPITDPAFAKYPEVRGSLHDYFIGKSLALARPGGLVAAITSHYTMDKKDSRFRRYLADRAQLVGAVRLPATAFKANAGTEVVTDILFLRKLLPGEKGGDASWVNVSSFKGQSKYGQEAEGQVNDYFLANPRMVLGRHSMAGEMYGGRGEYTVEGAFEPAKLEEALKLLPENAVQPWSPESAEAPALELVAAPGDVKQHAFTVQDGKLMVKHGEFLEPARVNAADDARIRGMIGVRDATRAVLDAQVLDKSKAEISALQAKLRQAYDAFTKKHGNLSDRANLKAFANDPEAQLLLALEETDPKTKKIVRAKIFTERTIQPYVPATKADSGAAALTISLRERGAVNLQHMSRLTGKSEDELATELAGVIFRNPDGQSWESAEEYLSGNVRKKLEVARTAASAEPAYEPNVKALEAVQLPDKRPGEISVRLGAPWLPTETVRDFIAHLLETGPHNVAVQHSLTIGGWDVKISDRVRKSVIGEERWGTKRADIQDLVNDALNLKQTVVRDMLRDGKSIVNAGETLAAQQKQQEIQEALQDWLWKEPARADQHVRIFNDLYNSIRNRKYDGSHLQFPGMNRGSLRGQDLAQHQKNAAWRIIQANPKTNALINHPTGAGKTIGLIAGLMERKRLGLSRKPAVMVPSHILSQWIEEWRRVYPRANLLGITEDQITPKNRQALMAKIATGKYDGIVMSWQALEKLQVRRETYKRFVDEQIADLEAAILEAKAEAGKERETKLVKQMEKAKQRLQEKLAAYLKVNEKDPTVNFEDLGIDFLGVDEAHGFKNLATPSKLQVAGVKGASGSNRAMDLYMKARYLNEHGGVVGFATATPIANTVGETYVLQKYLQPEMLKELGLQHFDSWAGNFGKVVTQTEYTATGEFKQKSRFAEFDNAQALSAMLAETMDTLLPEQLNLPLPKVHGGKPEVVEVPTPWGMLEYLEELAKRADRVRSRQVDPSEDNFLKITTDGRKAALDLRLVMPHYAEPADSKLNIMSKRIHELWVESADRKGTQLVFIDMGTPKPPKKAKPVEAEPEDVPIDEDEGEEPEPVRAEQVDLYNQVRDKIVKLGIPKEEIAFIHDAKNETQKSSLRRDLNNGDKRVLIGSTEKMGTGMNVQERLYGLHMLMPPWRPDQIKQAEGRIERQGNLHADWKIPIRILRYVTERSYDAVLWGINERKNRFITQFLQADPELSHMEDIGNTTIGYAEAKAIATGNPLIMEKVTVDSELDKLGMLHRRYDSEQYERRHRLARMEARPAELQDAINTLEQDVAAYEADKEANPKFSIELDGKTYTDRGEASDALRALAELELKPLAEAKAKGSTLPDINLPIGTFRGFPLRLRAGGPYRRSAEVLVGKRVAEGLFYEGEGPMRSIQGVLDGLDGVIDNLRGQLARAKKEVVDLREEMGKPFAQMEKYERLKVRSREIEKQLGITKEKAEAGVGVVADDAGGSGEEPPTRKTAAGIDDEDAARDRLKRRARGGKMNLGPDPAETAANLKDLGIIGAGIIRRGVARFAAWARRLIAEVGDHFVNLRRHLDAVWERAKAIFRGRERPEAPAGGPEPEPEGDKTGSFPFFKGAAGWKKLRDLGYSDRQIDDMTNAEFAETLRAGRPAGAPGGPDFKARRQAAEKEGAGPTPGKGEPRAHVTPDTAERVADSVRDYQEAVPIGKPGGQPDLGINVEHLSSEEDIRKAAKAAATAMDSELKKARGYRSWQTAEEKAAFLRALGYTEKEMASGRTAFKNDAEAMAAKEILADATRKTKDAAERLRQVEAEGGDVAGALHDLDREAARMAFIAAHFARRTAEVARTLASFRKAASDMSPEDRILRAVMREKGNVSPQFIAALMRSRNMESVLRALRAEFQPGWFDKWYEFYINGLLSGPPTGVANLVGNLGGLAFQVGRYGIAGGLEHLKGGQERAVSESFGALAAMKLGLPDAWRAFKDAVLHESITGTTRLEHQVGAIGGGWGKFVRTPGRFLGATDLALKHLSASGELYVQAMRKGLSLATRRGLRGEEAKRYATERAGEIIDSFHGQMHNLAAGEPFETRYEDIAKRVREAALYNTFNRRLGLLGSMLVRSREADPTGLLKVFFPFIRTPLNIALFTAEHTPANFVRLWHLWRKGQLEGSKLSDELAKPILGSLIGAAAALMANEGFITGGGPTDPRERSLKLKTGWKPYSFHVGDQYVSFSRLEPLGSILGMAGDFVELKDQKKSGDIVKKIVGTIGQNLTNKTFLHGAQNVFETWSDPVRYGGEFIKDVERSLVPNIIGRAAVAIDPTIRETSASDFSAIQSRLPFASKSLPAKRSGTGEPIVREGTALELFASPLERSTEKGKEADLERAMLEVDYSPSVPSKTLTIPGTAGKKVELTSAEYRKLQSYDERATDYLRRLVASGQLKRMPPEEQRKFFERIYSQAGAAGRKALWSTPSVQQRARASAQEARP